MKKLHITYTTKTSVKMNAVFLHRRQKFFVQTSLNFVLFSPLLQILQCTGRLCEFPWHCVISSIPFQSVLRCSFLSLQEHLAALRVGIPRVKERSRHYLSHCLKLLRGGKQIFGIDTNLPRFLWRCRDCYFLWNKQFIKFVIPIFCPH